MPATKIVCTMGPSALKEGIVERLIDEGMNCARLNFSHGDHATHLDTAQRVRAAAEKAGVQVAILADLQGPKIRVGKFEAGSIRLVEGSRYILTGKECPCSDQRAWVSYEALARDVRPGDPILLDDGLLGLRVDKIEGDDVVCVVETGGELSDRKGVNLPGSKLSLPALTEKDTSDLHFAVNKVHADYLALSFVRHPEDVMAAKALSQGTPVIAKLEKPEAVEHLEAIVDASDGIMVARGDLGVEMGPELVPMEQKRMIRTANQKRKLVITATQMLDSMIRNPRPTRAEATDVANAVLDGTDAVMLSGETASGAYPVAAVKMMRSLVEAAEAEGERAEVSRKPSRIAGEWEMTNAAARGASMLSESLPLMAIVVVTSDGRSADLLSGYRPHVPVLALTDNQQAAARLALRWGIVPQVEPAPENLLGSIALARSALRSHFDAHRQGPFALVTGFPRGSRTNTVTLQTLDE